jgi:hypothetical protein
MPWSPATEHSVLQKADFGMSMLPRTMYAEHKCGFKVVQYLAYGLTPIVTNNAVHRTMLPDEGLLLDGRNDVSAIVERIRVKPDLQERRRLHHLWRARYSSEIGARLWTDALQRFT